MIIGLLGGYLAGLIIGRLRGQRERRVPVLAVISFVAGILLYGWACFGFLGVYSTQLRWAFSTRIAVLLVVVPWLLGLGRPLTVANAALPDSARDPLQRFIGSRVMRVIGFAGFEPIFTIAFMLLFLTPAAGFMRTSSVVEAGLSILVPLAGLLMVLPIAEQAGLDATVSIGLEFLIAFLALIADAIPGLVLRLSSTIYDGVGAATNSPAWFQSRLQDQHLSGDILWILGESVDLPVLAVLFVRWSRIDRNESRKVDELSDEEFERLTQEHLHGGPRV